MRGNKFLSLNGILRMRDWQSFGFLRPKDVIEREEFIPSPLRPLPSKPMPLAAVMYVYIEDYRPDSVIAELGAELMQKFDLTDEDFHRGGPLVYLPREDYDLAHVEGEPGFLLNLNIATEYYYVGYERGDLPLFIGIAEWLEQKLPGCRVFYGQSSSGEGSPFDKTVRTKLMEYSSKVGSDLYFRKDISREQKDEIRALHSKDVPMMGRRE